MVSCPRPTLEAIQPLLATFGKVFFVGEKPGLAQVAKLGNNLLAAAALVDLLRGARHGRSRPGSTPRS